MKKHSAVPIDFNRLRAENEHSPSQLQSSVFQNLMRTLMNRQAIRNNINKTSLDVEWMPVSQLKRETLEKARSLLLKLKETIEKKINLMNKMNIQIHLIKNCIKINFRNLFINIQMNITH